MAEIQKLGRSGQDFSLPEESKHLSFAFGAAALISLLVAQADYQLANTARTAAAEIRRTLDKFSPSTIWFQGHWGFQYYAEAQGLRAFDNKRFQVKSGDLIVIPRGNTNVVPVQARMVESVATIRVNPCRWMSTMNPAVGAGFYTSLAGPLPFAFGLSGQQVIEIVRFK